MTTKFQKDEHTLLLVDFDGQGEYRLQSAKLTDDKGGRFGKGVRIEARQCLHRGDSPGLEGDAAGRNLGVLVRAGRRPGGNLHLPRRAGRKPRR